MVRWNKKTTCAYTQLFMKDHHTLYPAAQIVLRDLSHKSGAWIGKGTAQLTSFTPNDPYRTAFNEGKRYMFNYLLYQLQLNPYELNQLICEENYGNTEHNHIS